MEDPEGFRKALLRWYAGNRRNLPWRRSRDPYAILVAEVLLQQTRIAAGEAYYRRFLERFPTVESLAAADEEAVLRAWEGLGYYRRARHLHRAAREIVARHDGRVPADPEALAALPGVGPYTAGAVASIAYGVPVPAVDGNVVRVLARLCRIEEDVTRAATKRAIRERAAPLVPAEDPGTWNQALMELGSLVCVPKAPRCPACPVAAWCQARAAGVEAELPRIRPRPQVPEVPAAFAVVERDGRLLLVRRPRDALLGGLWALPGGELGEGEEPREGLRRRVREQSGVDVEPGPVLGRRDHVFSHRRWRAVAYGCAVDGLPEVGEDACWATREDLKYLPLVPFHRELLRSATTPPLWTYTGGQGL